MSGGAFSPDNFLKFGYVLNVIRRIQEPTSKCFVLTVSNHFECDGHQNAIGLSVPEIEPLVELSIAFDFCSSYCFIFIIFFVSLFVCKNTLGFSILTAQSLGKYKNSWVKSKYSLGTGEAKFSLGRGE